MLMQTTEKTYVVVEFIDDRKTGWNHYRGSDLTQAFNVWMSKARRIMGETSDRDKQKATKGVGLQAMRYARARDSAKHPILLTRQFTRTVTATKHDGDKAEPVKEDRVFYIEVHALHHYPEPPKTTEGPDGTVVVEGAPSEPVKAPTTLPPSESM